MLAVDTPWPLTDNRFPDVTCHDAVRVQQRLPAEVFGIQRVKRVYGWSMGGMQAYLWAVVRPELVERIAVACGSFRCAPHNARYSSRAYGRRCRPTPPSSTVRSPGAPCASMGNSNTLRNPDRPRVTPTPPP